MIITHKLQPMDLTHKQNTSRVDVVQDDKYSRDVEFTLTENGVAWQIPDGTTAIVRYKKPDGTGGNYDALPDGSTAYQINGNVLTVSLAPQVCTVPGFVQLSVGLIQGSAEINTFTVDIVVQPNPGATYQSEDYITLSGAVSNSGWTPNMYLGTDGSGNVVAKEGTSGGGGTVSVDSTLTQSGQAADAAVVGNRLSALSEEIANLPGVSGSGAGWSTEEIALLEIILGKAVYSTDQTNNIAALIALLKSSSSGSEGGDTGTTYTVTLNLTNVTPSNIVQSVGANSVYMNQLSVSDGYSLGTPVITMGGYDVTAQYYDGAGNISIPAVQGDIIITCKALVMEAITITRAAGVPNAETFEWTAGTANYWVAEPCSFTGGRMAVNFDTNKFVTWGFILYLFDREGNPYKISGNATNTANSNGVTVTLIDPATSGFGYVTAEEPFVYEVPDGCRAMLCIRRGSGTSADGSITTNQNFADWIAAGGIAITVTEGE